MTQLTALKLNLALRGESEGPLELPQLQWLDVYLTTECRPAREYASLQSTILTSLTLWDDTISTENMDPRSASNNTPAPMVSVLN